MTEEQVEIDKWDREPSRRRDLIMQHVLDIGAFYLKKRNEAAKAGLKAAAVEWDEAMVTVAACLERLGYEPPGGRVIFRVGERDD